MTRYYQPWLNSTTLQAVPVHDEREKRSAVHASRDTTLTALAQLAALRLNVKRGMVSLINADTQIILAEATQTLSPVDETRHAPGDHLWLGNVSLPRKDCVDEHVFGSQWKTTTAGGQEQTLPALVIPDLAEDDRFKHRSYVTAKPGVRFYAGVPIVTKQGYEIGVYAVSDEKPRPEGIPPDQILYMQDIARVVADHLERVKDSVDKARDEVFVRGISTFIEGLSALKHKGNDLLSELEARSGPEEDDIRATDPRQEPPKAPAQQQEPGSPAETQVDSSANSRADGQEDNVLPIPKHTKTTEDPSKENTDTLTSDVRQIFARASKTIQQGVGARGCIFLDSSSGLFSTPNADDSSQVLSPQSWSTIQDDQDHDWDSEDDASLYGPAATNENGIDQIELSRIASEGEKPAAVLGSSLAEPSDLSPAGFIKRKHLKQCLIRYPFGQCFFLDRGGITPSNASVSDQAITGGGNNSRALPKYSSMTHNMIQPSRSSRTKYLPKQLLDQLPEAKWIIFLPLYNFAQRQWFATAIIWSNEPNIGDLKAAMPYLKTFGSCIMSEVTSMEAFKTSNAKSTFIASISHDLRSPLHGLLGSLEFLEDTMTSAYQMSLVDSIETCGKTLLDTIDHLLDYAKINDLKRGGANRDSKLSIMGTRHSDETYDPESGSSHLTTFDFAVLLEEVVEAVFAGQTFRKTKPRSRDPVDDATDKIRAIGLDDSESTEQQISAGTAKFSGKVLFVLNIDREDSWCMRGQTGALRRVIMNLVGNAIKYCNVGHIEVSLAMKQTSDSHADVEINVKDTGVGMSQTFLQNHIFKAFSQENPFTPGTGLGLSIASQIVQNLKGKIRIKSEKGVGTHVKVLLPMQLAPQSDCNEDEILQAAARVTMGKKICLLDPMGAESEQAPAQPSSLTTSITKTCENWFQMTCQQSRAIDSASDASVYVYCEPPPIEYLLQHHSERRAAGQSGKEAALLIICTNAFEAAALRAAGVSHLTSLGRIVEVISQPVGTRKLAKVLLQSLQRVEDSSTDKESPHVPNTLKQSFATAEAKQRAAEVAWVTSSVVYDQEIASYRPSVQPFKWKSEQPLSATANHFASPEAKSTFGDIKGGDLPGLGSIPHKKAAFTNDGSKTPHVLLVDDNNINLRLLVTFMKKIKLPFAEATDGLEAFTEYKKAAEANRPFNFVLMDLQMPVMDGLESTRKIREFEKESQAKTPATIIAITGVGSESVRKEAMDAGMSQFLTKPVKFRTLQQLLELQHQP
ncbi:hypothetical protein PMZ80_003804 [Knufia obscura]|uniref:Uncharacterized protein n=1 Tax=Knufia obscura TaxID=1635080 RepID=A0ABR0RV87_9EURO|nr:hypothetical protein PMZ80_003804 [Knufia obscura]